VPRADRRWHVHDRRPIRHGLVARAGADLPGGVAARLGGARGAPRGDDHDRHAGHLRDARRRGPRLRLAARPPHRPARRRPRLQPIAGLVEQAARALSEHGEGFSVTSSWGSVILGEEATDPTDALRLADQRMYARKRSGRSSVGRQTTDVLLRALAERHPDLDGHSCDVALLAETTARSLGLELEDVEAVRQAAQLHDIGKVAIPETILHKAGPLDDDEWAFMRRHSEIGERIIGEAPALSRVAAMVRASHERFDGGGYPDGLSGKDIPLGARIVAVCDAFDAMITERPYSAAKTPEA